MPKHGLPTPSAEAAAQSQKLQQAMMDHIQAHGAMDFKTAMEWMLYHPRWGYYSSGLTKLGAAGDFTTAPEISPLFSECLAHACAQVFEQLSTPADCLEFGAGSGVMAGDILKQLDKLGSLPNHYYIIEVSAHLKHQQQKHLKTSLPEKLYQRVQWVDAPPENFCGVMLANEVLDAMPVHLFEKTSQGLFLKGVTTDQGKLSWTQLPVLDPELQTTLDELAPCTPYCSEHNPAIKGWVDMLSDHLQQGLVLLIDYGFKKATYYHPDRNMGTLMCHYQHRAHTEPLWHPGLQDITAHVDFTSIAHAARDIGLDVMGYTHQASFLMGSGLINVLMESDDIDTTQALKRANAIKKLTLPSEMGELFKVIGLSRGLKGQIAGFAHNDQQHRL